MAAAKVVRWSTHPELRELILRWLGQSVPVKEIERRCRVSRWTIRKLKNGTHTSQAEPEEVAKYVRHSCGNKVLLPCRVCAARAEQKKKAAAAA